MITDGSLLSIEVSVDDSVTSPNVSVSIGLIVTELVINALKHAFPIARPGKIKVAYHAQGSTGWILSVTDDGVGMPAGERAAKPGLGTGIVEALASQLKGEVTVKNAMPGTAVSITHPSPIGLAKDEDEAPTAPKVGRAA